MFFVQISTLPTSKHALKTHWTWKVLNAKQPTPDQKSCWVILYLYQMAIAITNFITSFSLFELFSGSLNLVKMFLNNELRVQRIRNSLHFDTELVCVCRLFMYPRLNLTTDHLSILPPRTIAFVKFPVVCTPHARLGKNRKQKRTRHGHWRRLCWQWEHLNHQKPYPADLDD